MMFNLKSSDSHREHKGSKCAEAALQAVSHTRHCLEIEVLQALMLTFK